MITTVTTDTKFKLSKIREGVVFDPLTFILEFYQNCQRAKASKVLITLDKENGTITFKDDGIGLKSYTSITKLDYSSWDTTNEGNGIGFWSFLSVPNIDSCEVKSGYWNVKFDVTSMFEKEVPEAECEEKAEKYEGFEVTLSSKYFSENTEEVAEKVIKEGELMQFDVYLNEKLIPKRNLFEDVTGDFTMKFENDKFIGVLAASKYGDDISVYYEKRFVRALYCSNLRVKGIIEMKPGALDYKAPDRREIISNNKKDKFNKILEKCAKELYLEFVKTADRELLNKYADSVNRVLDVKDYANLLEIEKVDDIEQRKESAVDLLNSIRIDFERQESGQLGLFTISLDDDKIIELLSIIDNSKWIVMEKTAEELGKSNMNKVPISKEMIVYGSNIVIGNKVFEKVVEEKEASTDSIQEEKEIVVSERVNINQFVRKDTEITTGFYNINNKNLGKAVDEIKKVKKKVWVSLEELDNFKDLKAKAEYYGVTVFIARNVLYETLFKFKLIPHISELQNGLKKTNIRKNVALKNNKEISFIKLLSPICEYYKLPLNTFLIGDLKLVVETRLDNYLISKEIIENTKNSIKLYAVTERSGYENEIIFDRKALQLHRYSACGETVGKNELKLLWATSNTIAHELAHLLYNTEDNTIAHLKKIKEIEEVIRHIYV